MSGIPVPPPPPPPPALSGGSGPAPSIPVSIPAGRDALLGDIRKGTRLKKAVTVDKSKPMLGNEGASSSSMGNPSLSNNSRVPASAPASGIPQLGEILAGGIPKLKHVNNKDNRAGIVPSSAPHIPTFPSSANKPNSVPPMPLNRPNALSSNQNTNAPPSVPSIPNVTAPPVPKLPSNAAPTLPPHPSVSAPAIPPAPSAPPPIPNLQIPKRPGNSESTSEKIPSIPGRPSRVSSSTDRTERKDKNIPPRGLPFLADINSKRDEENVIDSQTTGISKNETGHHNPPPLPMGSSPAAPSLPTSAAPKAPPLPTAGAPKAPPLPTAGAPKAPPLPTAGAPKVPSHPSLSGSTTGSIKRDVSSNTETPGMPPAPPIPSGSLPFLNQINSRRDESHVIDSVQTVETPVKASSVKSPNLLAPKLPSSVAPPVPSLPTMEAPPVPSLPTMEAPPVPSLPTMVAPPVPSFPTMVAPSLPHEQPRIIDQNNEDSKVEIRASFIPPAPPAPPVPVGSSSSKFGGAQKTEHGGSSPATPSSGLPFLSEINSKRDDSHVYDSTSKNTKAHGNPKITIPTPYNNKNEVLKTVQAPSIPNSSIPPIPQAGAPPIPHGSKSANERAPSFAEAPSLPFLSEINSKRGNEDEVITPSHDGTNIVSQLDASLQKLSQVPMPPLASSAPSVPHIPQSSRPHVSTVPIKSYQDESSLTENVDTDSEISSDELPHIPPPMPPSSVPALPALNGHEVENFTSSHSLKSKKAPPPPPPGGTRIVSNNSARSQLDSQQSSGANLRTISASTYTISGKMNTGKITIEDTNKRFGFKNENSLPNPRRFGESSDQKLYPSGRGSSVPLDFTLYA